jgi:hypothetical protein
MREERGERKSYDDDKDCSHFYKTCVEIVSTRTNHGQKSFSAPWVNVNHSALKLRIGS